MLSSVNKFNIFSSLLISNNDKLVNTAFARDSKLSRDDMILMAHDLAALNHLTVIKNAVPDSLSLLEQYEVENIEDLQMSKRWEEAEPNKSIRSLIGWRGKKDYVYWDLHERAHGPHALVGGTTGSGKSEFLTTYLIGLAINFSPEDIGMLVIDWKGGGIANTLADLPSPTWTVLELPVHLPVSKLSFKNVKENLPSTV